MKVNSCNSRFLAQKEALTSGSPFPILPFAYWMDIYGQLKLLPDSNISRMRVSIGVLPTNRTKNNCSMTEEDTVRREGRRSNNFPNRVGWLGYWLRTYSSSAHCDFSCKLSMWATSDRPQASTSKRKMKERNWHYELQPAPAPLHGINHSHSYSTKMSGCILSVCQRHHHSALILL